MDGKLSSSSAIDPPAGHRHEQLVRLHQVCCQYETDWSPNATMAIESYLAPFKGWERETLLGWLVRCDIELREQAGLSISSAEYLSRFPKDEEVVLRALADEVAWEESEAAAVFPNLARPCSADEMIGQDQKSDEPSPCEQSLLPSVFPRDFGHFELLDELARGGMGIVYRARQRHLGRTVAVKVLLAGQFASATDIVRFRQEAKAIARLDHAGVVPIYEVGEIDGLHYFSMPLLEGGSLADMLTQGPIEPNRAATIVLQAAQAVHAAHQQGIIHRDLKPHNILFDRAGQAKVADFGLAKLVQEYSGANEQLEATRVGQVVGTPAYMSPEQASGQSGVVTIRADIYALGAVLYTALTGRPPFQAATPLETIRQVIDHTVVGPRQLNAQIPIDLETIALKCLAKVPDERYASAQELAEDLQRHLNGQPILARRAGRLERAWLWCRHNPRWAGMFATIAGLLFLISIGSTLLSAWALREEAKGRQRLLAARLSEARAIAFSHQPGQRFRSLELLSEARELADDLGANLEQYAAIRNVSITALSQPDLYTDQLCAGFPEGSVLADFDDRFEIYARADSHGRCSVRSCVSDIERHLLAPPAANLQCSILRMSRNGRYLILGYVNPSLPKSAARTQLFVWRIDGSAPLKILECWDVIDVELKQDNVLYAVSCGGEIRRFELATGKPIEPTLAPNALTDEVFIAPHPFKPIVALGSYFTGVVLIRDETDGSVLQRIDMPGGASHAAWHPRGELLAITSGRGPAQIRLFDGETFQLRSKIDAFGGGLRLSFNHAGTCLASWEWGGVVRLWDVVREKQLMLSPYTSTSHVVRFSSDDERMAGFVQNGRLAILRCSYGEECRTLTTHNKPTAADYLSCHLSPDGKWLVAAYWEGMAFWNLLTKSPGEFVSLEGIRCVCFEARQQVQPDLRQGHGSSLLVSTDWGTYRLPMNYSDSDTNMLRLGPLQPTNLPPASTLCVAANGSKIAASVRAVSGLEPWAGIWLADADGVSDCQHLLAGEDVWSVSLSPDGKAMVSAQYRWGNGKLWDLEKCQVKQELEGLLVNAAFSNDGRWFMAGDQPSRIWDTRTWGEVRRFDRSGWFSPDGRLLALSTNDDSTSLVELQSGLEIGLFKSDSSKTPNNVLFTPDNQSMIVVNNYFGMNQWDLRLVQEGLSHRSLKLQHLDYQPIPVSAASVKGPSLSLNLGDWFDERQSDLSAHYDRGIELAPHLAMRWYYRALHRYMQGQEREAIADLESGLSRLAPNEVTATIMHKATLARWLACAQPASRDVERALHLASEAIALGPGEWRLVLVRGLTHFRAGDHATAINDWQACIANSDGLVSTHARYLLALLYREQQQLEQSQAYLAQAQAWRAEHADEIAEISAYYLKQIDDELNGN